MDRKYSVDEIDRMRSALRLLLIPPMTPYLAAEKNKELEERLRTYMMNGTDPEELERAAAQMLRAQHEAKRRSP